VNGGAAIPDEKLNIIFQKKSEVIRVTCAPIKPDRSENTFKIAATLNKLSF
jgi:hypothetical protein